MKMWICSTCKRRFLRKNQSHTCTILKPEDHVKNRPKNIVNLYKILTTQFSGIGVKFDAISFAINMKSSRNFGMLFIYDDKIKVEFHLPRKVSDPRIVKTAGYNKNYAHILFVREEKEIDSQVLNWIKESYENSLK